MQKNKFNHFDDYQRITRKTAIYPKIGKKFVFPAIALSEEVGEINGKIKRVFRDNDGKITKIQKMEIAKEIGDALWYLTQLTSDLNLKFSEVVDINLEKIMSRHKRNKIHGSGDDR